MTPPPSPLQPGSGAQPAKKSNVLLWILIGVGGFFALIVVAVFAGGLFLFHQARHAAGGVQFNSGDGTIQIGGNAKVPTWVPEYPGSNPQTGFAAQGKDGRSGTFTFKTRDSADHVAKFYREQLEASGLTVATSVSSGSSQIITAEDEAKHHTVTVVAGGKSSEATVSVTYASK
jgi:hypothetical protein